MTKARTFTSIILGTALLAGGVTACSGQAQEAYKNREQQQQQNQVQGESLAEANLKRRIAEENDPNRVGYLYVISFAKPFGYYVVKGKVSSSGSQLGPEQTIACPGSAESCNAVDSAQDDHTYGQGDPGVFFYTAAGVRVETTLDYIYSTAPLDIDAPQLLR
jgi:hypothetical protein